MNAQQLRNSILQEAIEGRLVPQDPNDEPASELLERIREEKKRLVKEGKLKKKDLEETPISEDEKPFEIPESWEWVRLNNIIFPPKYGTSNKSSLQGEVPVLRMGNIQDGEIVFDKLVFSNNQTDNDKYNLIAGDLLFNRTNSAELVGKTGIYRGQQKAIYAGYLILLRPIGTNSEYLNYVLGSSYARSYCKEVKTIGVQQCNINAEKISTFVIPLPPLAEQKRIVAKIEELLPKVEEYGKAQDALDKLNEELPEKLKKSILQEAIEGRLVPQDPNDEPASVLLNRIREEKKRLVKEGKLKKKDLEETPISEDEKPFERPESWEWVRMQDVIEFVNGRAYKRDELLDKGKYKVLRVGNFFTNESWYYSDLELPDEKYCYKDDLLYAWSASFGPKIWDGDKTIFHYHIWNVKYNKNILFRDYLFYFFLIDKESIKSATTGSTMVHVSMENMKPRLLPLPPLAEQKRIVAKIEEVFAEIDKLKA